MSNKRKPNAVHKLNGTLRNDRHGEVEDVAFNPSTPTPPDVLKNEALNEWNRVVPELETLGLLTIFDRMILTQYCLLTKELFDIASGESIGKDGQPRILNAAWHNQYKLIQQELGFTISSRASLKLPKRKEIKKSSPLDGVM